MAAPIFHLGSLTGWVNDPNGPLFHRGRYHLFYQLLPHTTHWTWGLAWGHAVSSDLVTWRRLPPALLPGDKHTVRQHLQQARGRQQQQPQNPRMQDQAAAAAAAAEAASEFLREVAAQEKAAAVGLAAAAEGEVQEQQQLAEAEAATEGGGVRILACRQHHAASPNDAHPACAITHDDDHEPASTPQAAGHGPRAREGGSGCAGADSSAGLGAGQLSEDHGEDRDPWFDADGCFSGCAVVDPRGVPTLLYTGVRLRPGVPPDAPAGWDNVSRLAEERQGMAVAADPDDPDLVEWVKLPRPWAPAPPRGMPYNCFRDTFVIHQPTSRVSGGSRSSHSSTSTSSIGGGMWAVMVGAGVGDPMDADGGRGCALVYRACGSEEGPAQGGAASGGEAGQGSGGAGQLADADWRYCGVLCTSPGPHGGSVWECPVLARSLPVLRGGGSSSSSNSGNSSVGDREVEASTCGGDTEGEEQPCAFFCVSPGFCGPIYWLGRYSDTREQQPASAAAVAAAAGATAGDGPNGSLGCVHHVGDSARAHVANGSGGGGGCPGEWAGGVSPPDCPCFHMDSASGPHLLDLGDTVYAPNLLTLPPDGCHQREQHEEQVGRVVMWAWVKEQHTSAPAPAATFAGAISLPRLLTRVPIAAHGSTEEATDEVTVAAGSCPRRHAATHTRYRLHQQPLPELAALRKGSNSREDGASGGGQGAGAEGAGAELDGRVIAPGDRPLLLPTPADGSCRHLDLHLRLSPHVATTDNTTHDGPVDASEHGTWQLTIRPAVPPSTTPAGTPCSIEDAAPAHGGDAAVLSYSFHTCRLSAAIGPADCLDAMCAAAAAGTRTNDGVIGGASSAGPAAAAVPLPPGCRALGGVLAGQRRGTPLELRVLLDASVLEVFALSSGEALTTRVNPPSVPAAAAAAAGGGAGAGVGGAGAPIGGSAEGQAGAMAGWAMSMGVPAAAAVREGGVREEMRAGAGRDGEGGGGAGVRVEWLRVWEMGSVWVAA